MKTILLRIKFLLIFLFLSLGISQAQKDVLMQAFYWNVPYDTLNNVGTWYQNLTEKLPELKQAGFEALWTPPPSKGNWGISDAGYGIYDHYDLGEYNQKGSVSTRYGLKQDLVNFITAAHDTSNSQSYMEVYADAVLNHKYGSWGENEENNPAVKAYQMSEAITSTGQHTGYLNDYIHWVIPDAPAGDYYIQVKGFDDMYNSSLSTYAPNVTSRGYDLNINWTNAATTDPNVWETEPNNGGGTTDPLTVVSGQTIRGHSDYEGDIDEFKFTITPAQAGNNVVVTLVSMNETGSGSTWAWVWGNQMEQNFYPAHIWYNGSDIAAASTGIPHLEAHTQTKTTYPARNPETGEASYQWDYTSFHPVDTNDWLGDWGSGDPIVPNTMAFGNDFNTYSDTVKARLDGWGRWLMNTIKFDGFRLDFVRGYQPDFCAQWVSQLPNNAFGQRPYIVGEYWTGDKSKIKAWIDDNANDATPAAVAAFDFPLHFDLVNMCNGDASWNMAGLNHAGMIRDNGGNAVPAANICTFVEDHDNAKNSSQWITKDWQLAYAYILTHQGRPMVFYTHYFGIREIDYDGGTSQTVTPPASLQTDINKLIFVRNTYLGGDLTVLSEVGSPSNGNTANIYVARRAGNGTKKGAIIVLNNAYSTQSIQVNTSPSGWSGWAGKTLVNALNPSETVTVGSDGRVTVQAGSRNYAIYVLQSDYVPYGSSTVPVTGVSVSPTTASIAIGGTQQLTATVSPSDASNQNVTWSSGNTAVATVSSTGLVTALANGTATITVTTDDGSYTATCTVNVSNVTCYTIINRWQSTYLYDGGTGDVLYGSSPSSNAYQWEEVPVSGASYIFLKNRATGNYMHIQDLNGTVECGSIDTTWWSAMWQLTSAGSPWDYIENRWQTSDWIHIQDLYGYAEYAGASSTWWSAMWKFQAVTKSAELTTAKAQEIPLTTTVSLYPNPMEQGQLLNLSIKGVPAGEPVELTVNDLSGKVMTQKNVSASCQVALNLPSGIYIIEIKYDQNSIRKKLVVK